MTHSVSVVVEPTHPMSSSNTKDNNIFRNSVGNYMSRKAYIEFLSTKEGCVSHKYLSPNESAWLMSVR